MAWVKTGLPVLGCFSKKGGWGRVGGWGGSTAQPSVHLHTPKPPQDLFPPPPVKLLCDLGQVAPHLWPPFEVTELQVLSEQQPTLATQSPSFLQSHAIPPVVEPSAGSALGDGEAKRFSR